MKAWKVLLGAGLLTAATQANATMTLTFAQDGVAPITLTSPNSSISYSYNYGDFIISASAIGSLMGTTAGLYTQTLDISSNTAATLTVTVLQDGLKAVAQGLLSTFTANGSGLDSVMESTYANGTLLASQTFGANNLGATYTTTSSNVGLITSDATSFVIKTAGAGGTANSTINIAAAVPEPASWAMMLAGFGFIGMALRSRRRPVVSFG